MYCRHPHRQPHRTYNRIRLSYCPDCHLISSKLPTPKFNPARLYRHYYHNQLNPGRFRFGLEFIIKAFRLFRALKIYTLNPRARTILDIGSGRGYQLYYLKTLFGYTRTVGTQLDPQAYHFSKHHLNLEIYPKDLLTLRLPPHSFHIITLWHVLEHLANPEQYLRRLKSLLTPNGTLIIEVPNYQSWTARLTGPYWLGLDLKYHLHFFTPVSLHHLLHKHGYTIRTQRTFSLEYSTFISVSSLVSRLTRTNHLIFSWIQGTRLSPSTLILHLALFTLLTPLCLTINLLLYFSSHGEVLLLTATKKSG